MEAVAAEVEEEAGCGGGVGRGGERGEEEVEEREWWRWEGEEEAVRVREVEVEVGVGQGNDAAEEDGSEVGEAAGSEEMGVELPYLLHPGGHGRSYVEIKVHSWLSRSDRPPRVKRERDGRAS